MMGSKAIFQIPIVVWKILRFETATLFAQAERRYAAAKPRTNDDPIVMVGSHLNLVAPVARYMLIPVGKMVGSGQVCTKKVPCGRKSYRD